MGVLKEPNEAIYEVIEDLINDGMIEIRKIENPSFLGLPCEDSTVTKMNIVMSAWTKDNKIVIWVEDCDETFE